MTLRVFWQGPAVYFPAQSPAEPFGQVIDMAPIGFTTHDRLRLLEGDSGLRLTLMVIVEVLCYTTGRGYLWRNTLSNVSYLNSISFV